MFYSTIHPRNDLEAQCARNAGKRELLKYLITIAQGTQGAEVWRALFSEILDHYPEDMPNASGI